jgi:transposase
MSFEKRGAHHLLPQAAQMWADGMSQRAIGKALGVSESTIAGLASRNRDKMPKRNTTPKNFAERTVRVATLPPDFEKGE